MPARIAALVYIIGILGLFAFNRDRKAKTSFALWIPVVWILIAASRMPTIWLQAAPSSGSADQYLEGSPLDRALLSVLVALSLIVLSMRWQKVLSFLRSNGMIVLFFLYCLASIIWSDYPDVAFKRWIKALGDLAMILIVFTDQDPVAALKRLLSRVGFVLVPVSVLFIKYYPDLGRGYNAYIWTPFYRGVATGKNELGIVCLIFGLGSVWQFLDEYRGEGEDRKRHLIAHSVFLAMVGWLLWQANSMTSTSCFLMASGLMVATSFPSIARRLGIVHFLVFVTLCISISALFLNVGSGLVESIGRDPSLTGRTEVWDTVLKFTGSPLVGVGFESFWLGDRLDKIWSLIWWKPNEAHNGYLETYLNLGWIGVMLLAGLIIKGYGTVIATFRRDPNAGKLRLAFFVIALIYNCTESAIRIMHPVWIFFLMATFVVPAAAAPEDEFPLGTEHTEDFVEKDTPAHALPIGIRRQNI